MANRKILFDVQRDEDIIDKLRTQVDVYEDSVYHYHKMVEIASYKDSIARQLIDESNRIKMQVNRKKSKWKCYFCIIMQSVITYNIV